MDIKKYIDSGILDSYVLGNATATEAAEVLENMAKYPEIQAEVIAIQLAMEVYLEQYEKTPSPALKAKISNKLFGQTEHVTTQDTTLHNPPANQIFKPNLWPMAASWALLAFSIGLNIFLYTSWRKTETKLAFAGAQNDILAKNTETLRSSYEASIAAMDNSRFKAVALKGLNTAKNAKATVYYNANTQEVYLTKLELALAPKGKQYQLWALVNGQPVDGGLIAAANLKGKMKAISNATGFAISLENTGGSTTAAGPKGSILLMGEV
jgi:anti-sigma-K factor RskA